MRKVARGGRSGERHAIATDAFVQSRMSGGGYGATVCLPLANVVQLAQPQLVQRDCCCLRGFSLWRCHESGSKGMSVVI